MSDTLKITIKLDGKEFQMSIRKSDEEKYRRAASDINSLISSYKKRFRAESEDYLAMAALTTAVEKVSLEMSRDLSPQGAELALLEAKVDAYLKQIG